MEIVVTHTLPKAWIADYEYQTVKQLSKKNIVWSLLINDGISLFAKIWKKRHVPFYIQLSDNYIVFRPLYIFPFQRFTLFRKINFTISVFQLWLNIFARNNKKHRPILWLFSLQHALPPKVFFFASCKIYDCVDDPRSPNPELDRKWQITEKITIRQSDIIFTNTGTLFNIKKRLHKKTYRVPIGCDSKLLLPLTHKDDEPQLLKNVPRPRVAIVGNISARIDFRMLIALIKKTPLYSYVFIGNQDPNFTGLPDQSYETSIEQLRTLKNVYFFPSVDRNSLLQYLIFMNIGLIPYDTRNIFTKHSFPMKLFDYIAAGLPVISTPILEMKKLPDFVTITTTANGMSREIKRLIAFPPQKNAIRKKALVFMRKNIWERKISVLLSILKREFPDVM